MRMDQVLGLMLATGISMSWLHPELQFEPVEDDSD